MPIFFSLLLTVVHLLSFFFTQPSPLIAGLQSLDFINPPAAYAATFIISGSIKCPGCASEPYGGYPNIPVSVSGPSSGFTSTGFNGFFSIGNLKAGTYLVSMAPGTCLTGVTQQTVTLGPNKSVNFTVLPRTVVLSGNVSSSVTGTGIPNVTITINSGAGTTNVTTDGSGNYTFSHGCSNYASATASINVPSGYKAASATTQSFSDSANTTVNFSLTPFNTISGTIYNDINRDGQLDNGETGHQGITVTLTNSQGNQTTTSDANGNYSFQVDPTSGNSTVTISGIPAGWYNTTATSQTVVSSVNTTGLNYGLSQFNTISGTVYKDTNENSTLDTGESGYQGITVSVTNASGTQTTTTAANGTYSFQVNPTAGNATVTISNIPAGWFGTTATSQTVASSVNTTGLNFGLAQYSTISGNVFVDLNKDGLIDNGEGNSTAAFSISVYPPAGTVKTNADGTYTITNLPPGTYTVSYSPLPNGYRMTSPLNGPPASYTVTVGGGKCNVNGAPGAMCQ